MGIPLVGGLAIPLHSLGVVLRYTLSVGVHDTEVVLRLSVPLIGGPAKPLQSLGVVLRNALSVGVHQSNG